MKRLVCLGTALLLGLGSAQAVRQMEWLDRGLVAVKTAKGVYLSWRILGTEKNSVAFNLYRDGEKIATISEKEAANYVDASGSASSKYAVKAVVNGVEQNADEMVSVLPNFWNSFPISAPPTNSLPDGSSYNYTVADGSTGDLDGDGKLDLVFLWNPSNMKDNSLKGYTGNVWMDGYTMAGKLLFRIDLGKNIRAGCHYTQFVVADFDGDGKAEIMVKTAPGTKDGTGKYLSLGSAKDADHSKDYRNSRGYILSGPEWLTVFRGSDGKELETVDYNPGRGTVSSWGDSYGNRVDRFLASAAWLDGKKPSGVFQRGYYTRMAITAYDWDGKSLTQRWYYNAATNGKECYSQGNHNLSVADVDNDGKDEIIEGACAIDHDGKFMYRTGLGHGDAMHLGDLDPDTEGLEVYEVHEEKSAAYGYEMHSARTGKILWGEKTGTDNGRGLAADVDESSRGYESWSFGSGKIQSAKGQDLAASRGMINFRVYWDADLLDETLEYEKVQKLVNGKWTQILTLSDYGVHANDGNKYTPCVSADLFGDWREEIVMATSKFDSIKIFTTTEKTPHRLYTLMHDLTYRAAISWQNTAYNQPPHLGFWLGAGTDKAPTPDIILVGDKTPKGPALVKQGIGASSQTVVEGDSIVPFDYLVQNCDSAKVEGLPVGIEAKYDSFNKTLTFSGTSIVSGEFTYTVTTVGGDPKMGAATRSGVLNILPQVETVAPPLKILSSVDAAIPTDGAGTTDNDNRGFLDSGFFNFNNSIDSYGSWHLVSENPHNNATLVIRYAHGKTDLRRMELSMNGSDLGAVAFKSTGNWVTWDSVSVNVPLKAGINILYLKSLSEAGGPNVDQFEFNVAGVSLFKDSTQLSGIDTSATDTSTTAIEPGFTAEDDLADNIRIASGVYLNFKDRVLITRYGGNVNVRFFDATGHSVAKFAANVPAGSVELDKTISGLSNGMYIVRVQMNGRLVQSGVQVKLEK